MKVYAFIHTYKLFAVLCYQKLCLKMMKQKDLNKDTQSKPTKLSEWYIL